MERKKTRIAAVAVSLATVIALTGTFAWQSISQMARNEATEPTNPGGRLHDDFSGYEETDTKDIYVENFGKQPIFARVRLDEYMEIGEGAGLKGTVGAAGAVTPNPDNHAESLVTGANIDDVTTWTTHIPGATSATTGEGTETGFTDPSKTFHTYWTWTMGGQATDNPDGKTVYMPTFNKNKDSLMADINGTLGGFDNDPDTGEHYDDYHEFANGDTASRVLNPDTTTYPDGAAYDADGNTVDECGPYGGAGGTGAAGTNYDMHAETHTAQETMNASVITMAEYKEKSDADKADFLGWVYDVDGWAYWSQPIAPGTPTDTNKYITNATGVLLDRIVLTQEPSDNWYYSINAVGQFITADDLGRTDDPKTGFFTDDGEKPSDDALDLLEGIGVNTAAVRGSITPSASVTVDGTVKPLSYAVQGMTIDLAAVVKVTDVASPDQNVEWVLSGNTNTTGTYIDASGVLHVAGDETGTLKIVAKSTAYDRLKGKLTLPVHTLAYTVTVTPDGGATSVLPGGTQGFTAVLGRNDFQSVNAADQTFNWALDTTGGAYKAGTTLTPNASDSSKATLTVAGNETADAIKLTATPTNTATYPGVVGEGSIAVADVTYTVNIKDSATPANTVTNTTVEVGIGGSATFTLDVTSNPAGVIPTDNWTWSTSNSTVAAVGNLSSDKRTIRLDTFASATVGQTATITATNSDYDPALEASFTAKAAEPTPADVAEGGTVRVDGVAYIVLLKDVTVNGKANGETTASDHKAALLLSKSGLGYMPFSNSNLNTWKDSLVQKYLNSDAASYTDPTFDHGTSGWLYAHPTIKDKALTVNIQTRRAFDDPTSDGGIENKVFLLSEADVYNTSKHGTDSAPQSWEYTYNEKIPYFSSNDKCKASDNSLWWVRSPAHYATGTSCVAASGALDYDTVSGDRSVRPAFWYNLDT